MSTPTEKPKPVEAVVAKACEAPAKPAVAVAAAPAKPAVVAPAAPHGAAPKKNISQGFLTFQKFFFGGVASCTAVAVVQPIDMIKVRLQLSGELSTGGVKNPFTMAKMLWVNEGPMIFYKGLSAALLRQAIYGTIRMGLFREVADKLRTPGKPISPLSSVCAGLVAGGVAAFVANPTDVSLVRMQADNTLPAAQRRNYKHVGNALTRIAREEGVTRLWRGCVPTMARAMALSASQLPSYDISKEHFDKMLPKPWMAALSASCVAAMAAAVASLPFDFVKTRIQKQKAGPDGKLPYKSSLDCVMKVAKTEGVFAFYKGFPAYFLRIAPISIVLLNTLELLNAGARRVGWQ